MITAKKKNICTNLCNNGKSDHFNVSYLMRLYFLFLYPMCKDHILSSTQKRTGIKPARCTFILSGLFFCLICFPQTSKMINTEEYLNIRGEVYFRFVSSRDDLELLSKTISIDRIHDDTVYAYANAKEFKSFLNLDLKYEVLIPPSLQTAKVRFKATQAPGQWNYYPTYDDYLSLMDSFTIKYPSISKLYEIGMSVQGRKLLFLKISDNVAQKEAEPEFMFTSSIHGDEVTGYILMLHLIDYLLSNYGKDSLVTRLIDNVEIWINPLANPDGTYKTGNSTVVGATRYNANSIDLNRNYPDPQGGQHPDGQAWQPETKATMDFMKAHHFVFSANYHGGSEVLNYPWDTWSKAHPDKNWFQYVSKQYADTVKKYGGKNYFSDVDTAGYTEGYDWYPVQGGRQDYVTYFLNGREITIEVSIPKMPSPSDLPAYWNNNYKAMLNYIGQCLFGIRGIVTDSITGVPLFSKVEVVGHDADNSFVYSDSVNGNYQRLIYPGNYNLKFSANGYSDKTINNISVENFTDILELNVELVPSIFINVENFSTTVLTNPFGPQLKLKFGLPTDGIIDITIYDITGKKIYQSESTFFNAGYSPFSIGSDGFGKGVYLCKISFNGSLQETIKVVKL